MTVRRLVAAALRAAVTPARPEGRIGRRWRAAVVRALAPGAIATGRLPAALDAIAVAGSGRTELEPRGVVERLSRWRLTCLQRAVAGYAVLRPRFSDLRFVIGVRRDPSRELVAHAWLEQGSEPLGEPGDVRDRYAVAFEHPPRRPRPDPEACVDAGSPIKDVILTELDDGTGVLLHLQTRFYYTLNRTGVAAWKLLAAGEARTTEAIAAALAQRFEGAPEGDVLRDVEVLVAELTAEGLVSG